MLLQLLRRSRPRTWDATAAWMVLKQHDGWCATHPSSRSFSTSPAGAASGSAAAAAAAAAAAGDTLTTRGSQCSTSASTSSGGSGLHDLLPGASPSPNSLSSSSSSGALDALDAAVDCGSTFGSFAAQPLEPLLHMMHPVVLSCSVWEWMHAATGLPWWASIPLTTVALRTALLPLTIKARSAGLNFVLAQRATQTADNLVEHWKQQQAAAAEQPGGGGAGSSGRSSGGPGPLSGLGQQGGQEQLRRPSKWRLSRMYYRYYRRQHGTTSLWWWTANVAVQVNVFCFMSLALRQMAAAQWPGFTDQGFGLITDLTQMAVVWPSAASAYAPYGVAGMLMPFSLVYLYYRAVQESPLSRGSLRAAVLLQAPIPFLMWYSCVSMPQAALLYWITNSAFFLGLQKAMQMPQVAAALKLPAIMMPPPRHDKEARERAELEAMAAQQLVCGSEDAGFLRFLASNYTARGMHEQALQCLERLTVLAPGDAAAFHALGATATELQRWPVAARAFERAAELYAVAVERGKSVECLLLAGKQWLHATAEARALQKRQQALAGKQQQGGTSGAAQSAAGGAAASGGGGGSGAAGAAAVAAAGTGADSKVVAAVQPDKQQEYIDNALHVLEQAVHFEPDAKTVTDGWYLLAMARTADGRWQPALEAAHTYWSKSCVAADEGEDPRGARVHAAAKLLPVLLNLCKQCNKRGDSDALLATAQLAVEVARSGWDRQSEEQLRDTLSAAAQAALAQGAHGRAQELRDLRQQLPCVVSQAKR